MSTTIRIEEEQHGLYARTRTASVMHFLEQVGLQLLALVIGMGLVVLGLAWAGYDAGAIVSGMIQGSVGSPRNLGMSLIQSVPLMLCAIAVWVAYQAGLFNIGGDGQLQVGGLVSLLTAVRLPEALPAWVAIPIALLAGCMGGGAWGAIAGLLRAYRGANEVISTIMLNIIASTGILLLIAGPFKAETAKFTAQSERVPDDRVLGDAIPGIPVIFLIALIVSIAVVLVVQRTALGLRLRAVGLNQSAAMHAGLNVRTIQWHTMTMSGAIAGLAGGLVIIGFRYYIAGGWAVNWGLIAIVIAFLALRSPIMITVWAVVFGMISASALTLKGAASVPDSVTTLMQAMPVICLFVLLAIPRTGLYRTLRDAIDRGRGESDA